MMRLLYEGKAKRVYEVSENELIIEFKDEVTALDGVKRDYLAGKGVINAKLSAFFFKYLEDNGVKTHFISYEGDNKLRVKKLKMIPIEVIVRNYAYGSMIKRLPVLSKLKKLKKPLIEFHYKSDELHDPLILPEDIIEAELVNENELRHIIDTSLKVNELLSNLFERKGLKLLDFKLEFGRYGSEILIGDEITGDTFRVIDSEGRHLDKEIYRKGASPQELLETYKKLLEVLEIK